MSPQDFFKCSLLEAVNLNRNIENPSESPEDTLKYTTLCTILAEVKAFIEKQDSSIEHRCKAKEGKGNYLSLVGNLAIPELEKGGKYNLILVDGGYEYVKSSNKRELVVRRRFRQSDVTIETFKFIGCISEYEKQWKATKDMSNLNVTVKNQLLGANDALQEVFGPVKLISNLNYYQSEVVNLCDSNIPGFVTCCGPPGSGKSTMIAEMVKHLCPQLRSDRETILICTQTNAALVTLLRKCLKEEPDMNFLIFGNREKIKESIKTCDENSRESIHRRMVQRPRPNERIDVIFSTLSQSRNDIIRQKRLSICRLIIDEAGTCSIPAAMMPLSLGIAKVLLVGDTNQLPPYFEDASLPDEYKQSIMKRLEENYPDNIKILRDVHRCHTDVYNFLNDNVYDNQLISRSSRELASGHLLSSIMILNCEGQECKKDSSIYAPTQINMVKDAINYLKWNIDGFQNLSIGILCPYKAQKEYIDNSYILKKHSNISTYTFDSVQGAEFDVTITTLVRSNPNGSIGFTEDRQRANVALSRSKELQIIITNVATYRDAKDNLMTRFINERYFINTPNFSSYLLKSHYERLILKNPTLWKTTMNCNLQTDDLHTLKVDTAKSCGYKFNHSQVIQEVENLQLDKNCQVLIDHLSILNTNTEVKLKFAPVDCDETLFVKARIGSKCVKGIEDPQSTEGLTACNKLIERLLSEKKIKYYLLLRVVQYKLWTLYRLNHGEELKKFYDEWDNYIEKKSEIWKYASGYFYNRGQIDKRHGRVESAKKFFQRVLDLKCKFSILKFDDRYGSYACLGEISVEKNNVEEAIVYFTKGIKYSDDNGIPKSWCHDKYGSLLQDEKKAVHQLEKAFQKNPSNLTAYGYYRQKISISA